MSDDVLKIIPSDCQFVPDAGTHTKAVQLLESMLPDGEMCEVESFDNVEFIDAGSNLEAILCPACGDRFELDPFTEGDAGMTWWYKVQDSMMGITVEDLQTTMPCCNASIPFTTLSFDWAAGFARFELSIWNPNISRTLNEEELTKLERTLGCELRQVRAHY
ncbi:MAG: hypothetical protein ACR2RD_18155 [Woeseiaceae bacterium]